MAEMKRSERAEFINETTPWQNLTDGLQIYEPATSRQFHTGEWRANTTAWDTMKCKQCLICVPYCTDSFIPVVNGKRADFDLDHCKGCGICVKACSFTAISIKEVK